jgi:hypothetical protein
MATTQRMPEVYRNEQGGTFRVLVGAHLGDGPAGCDCDHCLRTEGRGHAYEAFDAYAARCKREGRPALSRDQYRGDLVECKQDLTARFNAGDFSKKFERVGQAPASAAAGGDVAAPEPFPLERMTVPQLLMVAEEEEVEVKGVTKKEDLVRLIRAATQPPAVPQ